MPLQRTAFHRCFLLFHFFSLSSLSSARCVCVEAIPAFNICARSTQVKVVICWASVDQPRRQQRDKRSKRHTTYTHTHTRAEWVHGRLHAVIWLVILLNNILEIAKVVELSLPPYISAIHICWRTHTVYGKGKWSVQSCLCQRIVSHQSIKRISIAIALNIKPRNWYPNAAGSSAAHHGMRSEREIDRTR